MTIRQPAKRALALTAALLVTVCGAHLPGARAEEAPVPAGFESALENDRLHLYVNRETAEVAVRVKETGATWYSNPQDRDSDGVAEGMAKLQLGAQLLLDYYNAKDQPNTMDSYNDCVANGQMTIDGSAEGELRVRYRLGIKTVTRDDLPRALTEERFAAVTAKLPEDGRAEMERWYERETIDDYPDAAERADILKEIPALESQDLYVLQLLPEFIIPELYAMLEESGYTDEDLRADNAAVGYTAEIEATPSFSLTLHYRLDGDDLIAYVDGQEIEAKAGFPLYRVSLLPYFGAASSKEEGYLVVPDGSGALIEFNNQKTTVAGFSTALYGSDEGIHHDTLTRRTETATMPVFGLKRADGAVQAIIEEGDGVAAVSADVSGRYNDYNYVYSQYVITQKDEIAISGNTQAQSTTKVNVYQASPYQGRMQLRYQFLPQEQASYVGMADAYRHYLLDRGQLPRNPVGGDVLPLHVEVVGGIPVTKTFLGIPYEAIEPLTTYDQAVTILEDLRARGITAVKLTFTGGVNGGIETALPTTVNWLRELGGQANYRALADYAREQGVDLYLNVPLTRSLTRQSAFQSKRDGARMIDKNILRLYPYDMIQRYRVKQGTPVERLSPGRYAAFARQYTTAFERAGLTAFFFPDIGSELTADYRREALCDRQQAIGRTRELLDSLSGQSIRYLLDTGNVYSLQHAGGVWHQPLESSRFNIVDASIPYVQIVLHGYLPYSGEPINLADDYETTVLKIAECGAVPYFLWTYNQYRDLKESDYNSLYATDYTTGIDRAAALYEQFDELLGDVQGQRIVGHERLPGDVVRVTYEGGKQIAVNYGYADASVDGTAVPARSFAQVRGMSR